MANFIKVKWIKAHYKYAYHAGESGYVNADKAPALIQGGFIMPVPDAEEEKINPLPTDLPSRTLLFNAGFSNLKQIKDAGDSLLDCGISNASFNKIKAYLNK